MANVEHTHTCDTHKAGPDHVPSGHPIQADCLISREKLTDPGTCWSTIT